MTPDDDEQVIPVFIPALVVLLESEENRLNRPLTRDEVESIRDAAVCMMMRSSLVSEFVERRGYTDVSPGTAWEEWQLVRRPLPEQ